MELWRRTRRYTTPCNSPHPTTCSCLKECYTAWGGESAIPGGRRVCYTDAPGGHATLAADLTGMYTGAQARLHMNGGHLDLEAMQEDDRERLGALPLEQCPAACTLHGWCNEKTQCTCFEGWTVRRLLAVCLRCPDALCLVRSRIPAHRRHSK